MPPKRAANDARTEEIKKFRSAIDAMADDWVCPITCELPVDPVVAEDGHVYERSAIEEHIRTKGAELKSPMTGLSMGRKLLPSAQARNTIEKLVRTGAITGDKADSWTKRIKDEERLRAMRGSAEAGDLDAMHNLGALHELGSHGLKVDYAAAYSWYKKAADAGHVCAMAYAGCLLLPDGLVGVVANPIYGMGLIFRAAEMGSARAASELGDYFYEGRNGLHKDLPQAKYWYGRVATATYPEDLGQEHCDEAAARVQELHTAGVA